MPYRHRDSMSRKLRAARDVRERKRLEGPEPRYPRKFPSLRRTLVIIDHDFGRVEHRIDLYRTERVDCYWTVADGVEGKQRIGWSRVLRPACPCGACGGFRLAAMRAFDRPVTPTLGKALVVFVHPRRESPKSTTGASR